MIKLSIIIPVYNAEKYIENTINTILKQDYDDYEILIINDGSEDLSLEICERFARDNTKIKIISKKNEGVSVARNIGITKAQGEWITFVDADDGFIDNALCVYRNALDMDCNLILGSYTSQSFSEVRGSGQISNIDVSSLRKCILNFSLYSDCLHEQGYDINTFNNWTCWGKFYKRNIIIDNNISFPVGITHGEDLVFLYDYYRKTKKAICVNQKLYYYRIDNESVTRKFNARRVENTNKLFSALKEMIIDSDEKDFYMFVCNRVFACCYMYFANNKNMQGYSEKLYEMKEFCEQVLVHESLNGCNYKGKMSKGRKTNCFMKLILRFLKSSNYGLALFLSEVYSKTI